MCKWEDNKCETAYYDVDYFNAKCTDYQVKLFNIKVC